MAASVSDRLTGWSRTSWWKPAVRAGAVAVPFLVCALLHVVTDHVTAATSVLVLVLFVVVAATTGDRTAGVLAALSSGLWFDFFLVPPMLTFTISDSENVEATTLLVVISLAVTEVALWGRRQQAQASQRSGYLEGVLQAARTVAETDGPPASTVELVRREIRQLLGADECRFVEGPLRDPRIAVIDHDGGVTRDGRRLDVDRAGLPTDEYVAVLVRRGDGTVGHFVVTASTHVARPTVEQRRVAVLLADQVSAALIERAS